MYFKIVLPFE